MTTTGPRDHGAALILTLFATTLVMILGTSILTITVNDLRTARLARDSASALATAEAGVAQITSYIRTYGVSSLSCGPSTCAGPGGAADPMTGDLDDARRYEVWVDPVDPLPGSNPGVYRVTSIGTAGPEAERELEVELTIGTRPIGLPLAIFARSVNGGGNASVTRESILSTGCVYSRRQIKTEGIDAAYKIPAAVHSSLYVSENHTTGGNCGPSNQALHQGAADCASGPSGNNKPDYRWDHSVLGGAFAAGSDCAVNTASPASTNHFYKSHDFNGDGKQDVIGSFIRDSTSLRRLFGIPDQIFTEASLESLRAVAASTDTLFTDVQTFTPAQIPAWSEQSPHLVVYFDLRAADADHRLVDLKDVDGWGRRTKPGVSCVEQSLLVVVEGGDVKLNGNQQMVANIVLTSPAPYGRVSKANGTADLIGTIYADTVDLTGTVNVSLDDCFLQNLSPSLIDTTLSVTSYREVDRVG